MISESGFPIKHICDIDTITRPTFYRWRDKTELDSDKELRKIIHEIALEFQRYGYRRITAELHRRNISVNSKRVRRIMKEEKLIYKQKKRFKPATTNSNHSYKIYPNLTKGIEVTGLNQVWVADITYVFLTKEFVYLAAILDVFSRRCIGWCLSRNIDTQLTLNALNMAIANRKPLGFGLIHHSDRGVQYASTAYVEMLNKHGIKISMSGKGNAYDNAFAESFMKTLKVEEVYLNEYNTFEEAYRNIEQFIEEVYNKKRLHSGIGYLPPEEFEQEILNRSKIFLT